AAHHIVMSWRAEGRSRRKTSQRATSSNALLHRFVLEGVSSMATFYKGFVYETDVSDRLIIEGVLTPFDAAASDADLVARRCIDDALVAARDKIRACQLA